MNEHEDAEDDESDIALRAMGEWFEIVHDDELSREARLALVEVAEAAVALRTSRLERERAEASDALVSAQRVAPNPRCQGERAAARHVPTPRAPFAQVRAVDSTAKSRPTDPAKGHAHSGSTKPVVLPRVAVPAESTKSTATQASAERRRAAAIVPATKRAAPIFHPKGMGQALTAVDLPLTGADLRAWRSRRGLTQVAAATVLGVAQGTISKAESRPGAVLGPALHAALARALGRASTITP